jgi:hypothetical protein
MCHVKGRKKTPLRMGLSDDELLEFRLCDLDVRIEGSFLEERIETLYSELAQRGIEFRPFFWLSDEWFTPDGIPGSALAFYMTHPRLMDLERRQMLEVEGGTHDWCMRILRHEAGHALDNAYQLRRKRRRQLMFGKSSEPYPEYYSPKPYSRSYVVHLDSWYAQSHPDEDFAETFAVWLAPDSGWESKYALWPARRKLQYMDQLMSEIAKKKPLLTTRRTIAPLARLRKSLRMHYAAKKKQHQVDFPKTYDRDLRQLFSSAAEHSRNQTAAAFLSRSRKQVRRSVARRTGVFQYTIDQVLNDMITRCRELDLRLRSDADEDVKLDFAILLTAHTMDYLHSGRYRFAL